MSRLGIIPVLLLTCAFGSCQTKPPKVVEVIVTKIVPVPAELTEPCKQHAPTEKTVAEAVRMANLRKAALDECSSRMARIRGLTP